MMNLQYFKISVLNKELHLGLLIIFYSFFFLLLGGVANAEPLLVSTDLKLKVKQEFYVHLTEAPKSVKIYWSTSKNLKIIMESNESVRVLALKPGSGKIVARFNKISLKVDVLVQRLVGTPTGGGEQERSGTSQRIDKSLMSLLEKYRLRLRNAELHDQFTRQNSANENRPPDLRGREAGLRQISVEFLRELSNQGRSLVDLQRLRDRFRIGSDGGTPLFPGAGVWDTEFLGTERALMFGRTEVFDQVFRETLVETWRHDPNACVFGDILIGSSGGRELKGLSFPSDLDRSTVALDPHLNVEIRNQFEHNLGHLTHLDMLGADAVLTAHASARPDVFIGHWGQNFTELHMLKRSHWSLIEPVFNAQGEVIDIRRTQKSGSQLFWEVAFRSHDLALRSGRERGPEVEFPRMDLTKEPMLSMEMLRHGIHDIRNGPYSRGQQIIKILKYAERSYFMNKKAVAEYQWNPYEQSDPRLAQLATEVGKNKVDYVLVERLLKEFAGEEITENNVDRITDRIIARSEIAMGDNAARSLAFRLNRLGKIDDIDAREAALDRLWRDLGDEIRVYGDDVRVPPIMQQAHDLVRAVLDGTLSPDVLNQRAQALHQLLDDAYRLSETTIDRIFPVDYFRKIALHLKNRLGWVPEKINKFIDAAREKYPNASRYASRYAGGLYHAVQEFNKQCLETTQGSGLLRSADFADNALTIYEAYLSGNDENEALKNACLVLGEIALQDQLPVLQLPIALYKSVSAGDPKPIGMAIAFRLFPVAGQIYMTSQLLERSDKWTHNASFYDQLGAMLESASFNTEGKITGFVLRKAIGQGSIDDVSVSPPGNREQIVKIFTDPLSPFFVSSVFRYWRMLAPSSEDKFGLYKRKLERLRSFFPTHNSVRNVTLNLQAYYEKPPKDKYAAFRKKKVAEMEQALNYLVWIAMADSLEDAVKATTGREEWDKELKRLQSEFSLGNSDVESKKGLVSKVKWEIWQQSSRFTGENEYVVAAIYKKYINAYQSIEKFRFAIRYDLWQKEFKIKRRTIISPPMKWFLSGSRRAAPRLIGDPKVDLAVSRASYRAHLKMAQKIKLDLREALGRSIELEKDQKHLRVLGQFGFEMEHLRDDCKNRKSINCSPEIRESYLKRKKEYKDYLDNLSQVSVRIIGTKIVSVGQEVPLHLIVETGNDNIKNSLVYRWMVSDGASISTNLSENVIESSKKDGDTTKKYRSDKAIFTAIKPGRYSVMVDAKHWARAGRPTLAKVNYVIEVIDQENEENTSEDNSTDENGSNSNEAYEGDVVLDDINSSKTTTSEDNSTDENGSNSKKTYKGHVELEPIMASGSTSTEIQNESVEQEQILITEPTLVEVKHKGDYKTGDAKPKPSKTPQNAEKNQWSDNEGYVIVSEGNVAPGEGSENEEIKGEGKNGNVKSDQSAEEKNISKIEKEWIAKIEDAYTKKDWKKLLEIQIELTEANRKKYHSASITREPYLKPVKLLDKYLKEFAQKKWGWFKKDVPRYLNELFNKSEAEYTTLENKVNRIISEKKGTQEEVDKCLETAKKEAKTLRKTIGEAKKEHTAVMQKLFDNQGSSVKVLGYIKHFLTKYNIPQNLKVSIEYSGPCINGSDKNGTELKVKISGSKSYRIKPTETVTLRAIISGGKAPVDIHWEGGNISPSGSIAIFAATTPGNYSVQVTAKDEKGQSKSDSVMIVVKELNLPKLSGLANEVYYGTSTLISVEGIEDDIPKNLPEENSGDLLDCATHPDNPFCVDTSTGDIVRNINSDASVTTLPADDTEDVGGPQVASEETVQEEEKIEEGEYEYVWQPSGGSGLEFDPYQGKEPQVKVTFGKVGDIEIWAEVHKAGEYIGDTEPITTKAIPPKFTLKIEPKTLYIGDEGKAIITLDPNIDDKFTDFTWLPMGKNAQKLIESGNGRSTTFKLRSIKPTTIEVWVKAKSPYYGGEIGKVKYVVSAKPYKVSVSKPKRLDKAPSKWDIKQGKVVELPQAIAVFQNAEVHATITPEPKEKVSYKWTVTPEGCTISAPMSKSTNLNAHEAKTYTVIVKVSDKNGIELGKSSTSHTVTVSQRDLDVAKQKAEEQQKAKELLQVAHKLWKEGKLQQAIAKVAQAQKLIGKDKEIAKTLNAMQKLKKQLDDKLIEASRLIKQGKLDGAKKVLDNAAMISAKYEKYKEVLKQLTDAKKKAEEKKKQLVKLLKDAKALKAAGKLGEAIEVLQKGSKQFPVNKEIDTLIKEVKKQQDDARIKMVEGQAQWKNGVIDKAVSTLKEALKIDPSNKQITQVLKGMQGRKKIMDDTLKKTDGLIGQKKLKQAQSILEKAKYFNKKYPPYIAMVEKLKKAKEKALKEKKEKERIAKLLKKSKALKNAGKLSEAVAVLEKEEKQFPKNEEIKKLLKEIKGLIKDKEEKKQKDALKKMKEGQVQWGNGILDKAILTIKKATRIDPSNRQIKIMLEDFKSDKKKMNDLLKKVDGLIGEQKFKQAKVSLVLAEKISKEYPPYIEMRKKLDDAVKDEENRKALLSQEVQEIKDKIVKTNKVKKMLADAKTKWQQDEGKRAIVKLDEILKISPAHKEVIALKQSWQDILKERPEDKNTKDAPEEVPQQLTPQELAYAKSFSGKWNSSYGAMELKVQGLRVSGNYTHDKGQIDAVLSQDGKTMKGTWAEAPSYKGSRDAGKMHFKLSSDGKKIDGLWSYGNAVPTGNWTATRIVDTKTQPPAIIEQKPLKEIKIPEKKMSAKYLGCYKEKGYKEKVVPSFKNRVMNGYNFRGNMTVKKCSETCLEKGFKYAGLQYANECFCDNSYEIYGKTDNCNMPCTGNKNEMCGGAWANSVYALNSKSDVEEKPTSDITSLVGSWSFGRSKHYGKPVQEYLCNMILTDDHVAGKGYKIRSCHANESYWILEGKILLFTHLDGTVTTKFTEVKPNYWEGTYVGSAHSAEGIVHYLKKSNEEVDTPKANGTSDIVGKTKTSTSYAPNNKGDVFKGGHWAGASGGSDWLQKDFSSPQLVTGIYISRASTDITTKGFKLVLKLKKTNGQWITIDELHDTNINRTVLSGGTIGKSIPNYSKNLSPAIKATAFRLEFSGHGWFDATDIRIYRSKETVDDAAEKRAELAKKIKAIREAAIKVQREAKERERIAAEKAELADRIRKIREEAEKSEIKEEEEPRIKKCTSFIKIKNAGIPGYNTEIINNISLTDCKKVCTERSWCKSVDYKRGAKVCYVQNVDQSDVPLKRDYPGNPYDHYGCIHSQLSDIQKSKTVDQFKGTLSGTWSGKGTGDWKGWTSNGTFTMNISKSGKISGSYYGDDKGKLSGSVSSTGKLNMKSGGGSAGSGKWGGTMETNSQGKLQGSGTWSVDGFNGVWHGNEK